MKSRIEEESRRDRHLAHLVLGLAGFSLAVVLARALRLGMVIGWQGYKVIRGTDVDRARTDPSPPRFDEV